MRVFLYHKSYGDSQFRKTVYNKADIVAFNRIVTTIKGQSFKESRHKNRKIMGYR